MQTYNLITGAGGTIGSALTGMLDNVIAFGHGEQSLYKLDAPVKILGDIRDTERLRDVFEKYFIGAIYHTAAHKHVRFGESNVNDFISNNIIGTQNLVRLAREYVVGKFVLMSTDKAVEPINTMGFTKRIAEIVTLDAGYTVVRSGNVAWSRGSVLPHWEKQIESGGPLTLTDPRVKRYFITGRRLADFLVRMNGNHIFIPLMKEYSMLDIANAMIGGRDIDIEITGLTPGEKLKEKLWYDFENPVKDGDAWRI